MTAAAEPPPSDCLFCKIVARQLPVDVVAESATALAFRDVAPQAPIHVLVVPKRHLRDASTLSPQDTAVVADLVALANEVTRAEGIDESGFRLVMNVGSDGGNTVPHLHMHVLGGRQFAWPPG